MTMLKEFLELDKTKENVLKFLDKHKDDNRPETDLEALSEYAELYAVIDSVLESEIINYNLMFDDNDDNFDSYNVDYYWTGHPVYLRAERANKFLQACRLIDDWTDDVFYETCLEPDGYLLEVWQYIEKLIRNKARKGLDCECHVSNPDILTDESDNYDDYDDYDNMFGSFDNEGSQESVGAGNMIRFPGMGVLDEPDEPFEPEYDAFLIPTLIAAGEKPDFAELCKIRDNLSEMSQCNGAMTLCFIDPKTDRIDCQLRLASRDGRIFVDDGEGMACRDGLIVPFVDGLVRGGDGVCFICC